MKAHYIPRFYLAGFVDPVTPPRHEPFLHIMDLAMGDSTRGAPKKTATIADYYNVVLDSGEVYDDLEKALSSLEGFAATLMRTKLSSGSMLSDKERVLFAEFVGTMAVRVPVTQNATAKLMSEEGAALLRDLYAAVRRDPSLLERMKENIKARTGKELSADFSIDELDPDELEIEATRNAVLVRTFKGMQDVVPYIAAMRWRVLKTTGEDVFVTSDAPVTVVTPSGAISHSLRDMTLEHIELTMPITRNLALRATADGVGLDYDEADHAEVVAINRRTAYGAGALFASTDAPPGLRQILADSERVAESSQ